VGNSELNICINTLSFSQLASKDGAGFEQAVIKCVEMGVKNIELNETDAKNKDHVLQLFNDVKNYGGKIVVLTLGLNLLGGDVRSDEKYFNKVKNWIKVCSENDCRVLRLKATPEKSESYSENDFKLLYRNLLNILSSVEKNNVKVSIDTGEKAYSNMNRLTEMIEDIGSEMIGMTLDTRIVSRLEEHKMLERVAPLVNHVTVKEDVLKNPGKNILEKTIKALKTSAYTGYVSLEAPGARSIDDVSNYVNKLKEILSV
jgi:sugar phosphate isomerase/epimerase